MYRGMAGRIYRSNLVGANLSKQEKAGGQKLNPRTFNPEGVEGYIPFAGPLKFLLNNFANGIKSGMSYSGAFDLSVLLFFIQELRKKAKLVQITNSGFKESNVHGITQFD